MPGLIGARNSRSAHLCQHRANVNDVAGVDCILGETLQRKVFTDSACLQRYAVFLPLEVIVVLQVDTKNGVRAAVVRLCCLIAHDALHGNRHGAVLAFTLDGGSPWTLPIEHVLGPLLQKPHG